MGKSRSCRNKLNHAMSDRVFIFILFTVPDPDALSDANGEGYYSFSNEESMLWQINLMLFLHACE